MTQARLRRIGLTGGVGSGKSCVADLFREAGVTVVNLDQVGRELTDSDPRIQAAMRDICGPSVVGPDGKIDRAKVREVIFADSESRRKLEAVLHPLIWERFEVLAREAAQAGKKIVVCEAALLIEAGIHKKLDGLILVSAPEEVRVQRIVDRDRISAILAEKMIRTQLKDSEKRAQTTVVIENKGSMADLSLKVQEVLDGWRAQGLL